ncbi:hypothetical protein DFH07DRAFT_957509 [Mycena maculata]|uniref:Uncharacterized protein n=1 Tax=Mycena maculata TaxID=230809 RepID=A0AAD7JEB6_9AGAR|nr:hypothetical protein DFH07DRAFT_957509 [Mycena maculata]
MPESNSEEGLQPPTKCQRTGLNPSGVCPQGFSLHVKFSTCTKLVPPWETSSRNASGKHKISFLHTSCTQEVWQTFEGDNLIHRAEDSLFFVSKGILAYRFPGFRDMLSLPVPRQTGTGKADTGGTSHE